MSIVYNELPSAYPAIARELIEHGRPVESRDGNAFEIIGHSFTVHRAAHICATHSEARRWSLAYFAGELAWYLSGSNRLDAIAPYSSFWRRCSDDGVMLNSSYGAALFRPIAGGDGVSQWGRVLGLLTSDRNSRRAIVTFQRLDVNPLTTLDMPCTVALQFILRGHDLHAIATMRSNDYLRGLAYDAPFFMTLQSMLAFDLNARPATYTHQVGSMHYYARDALAVQMIADGGVGVSCARLLLPTRDGAVEYLQAEAALRGGTVDVLHPAFDVALPTLPGMWDRLLRDGLVPFWRARRLKERDEVISE